MTDNTVRITVSQHVTSTRLTRLHNAIVSIVNTNVDIVRVRTPYPTLDIFNVSPDDYVNVSDILRSERRSM